MKILAVSNFYPPQHVSGYALLCADVLNALRGRSHEISVLTSNLGGSTAADTRHDVHRLLTLESPLDYYQPVRALLDPSATRRNVAELRRLVTSWAPDVIFIWGMWNLSKTVAAEAERLASGRVVYYLANPWPIEPNQHRAYWKRPTRRRWLNGVKWCVRQVAKVTLHDAWREVPLGFDHAPCCSRALRDQLIGAGVALKDAPIIYEGIDVASYVTAAASRTGPESGGLLSFVYVGLLVEHKGVHTAIDALARLKPELLRRVRLTILGSGHPDYERMLHQMVLEKGLDRRIVFADPIPRSELAALLAHHHALLMPSIWEEPLALIMQEALASGLAVVASATGGTTEVIVDGENGLLFKPGDARRLAEHIEQLASDPARCRTLGDRGQQTARDKFSLERMVDDLESYLTVVAGGAPSG